MLNFRLRDSPWLILLAISSWGTVPRLAAREVPTGPQASSQSGQSATTAQDGSDDTASQTPNLTDEVVRDILSPLQRGLETHRLAQVLAIFDPESMSDYDEIRNQLTAFLDRYDPIQFRYQVLQAVADKSTGFATADIDIDAAPLDDSEVPLRRTFQLRLQIKPGPKGWKVIAFKPADLFAQ